MGSKREEEKVESIKRWLESVCEDCSFTTHERKTADNQETEHQHQQHSQPPQCPHSQLALSIESSPTFPEKMVKGKRTRSPSGVSAARSSKRRVTAATTTTGRVLRGRGSKESASTRSVNTPSEESRPESSHAPHQTHTSIWTRLLRDRLSLADPSVEFLPVEWKDKAYVVTALFTGLINEIDDAVPSTLR